VLNRIFTVRNQHSFSRASPFAFHGVGPSSVSVNRMLAMLDDPTRSASIAVTSATK